MGIGNNQGVPTRGQQSLIVALDVPTVAEAMNAVDSLGDSVSFFKIGLQLFMTGELPTLLRALRQKEVFVDLKVPGDIANTIGSVIDVCVEMGVRFLTLSESMPLPAIRSAKDARDRRSSETPKLLTVPFLSSLDSEDLKAMYGVEKNLDEHIKTRARAALMAGCDGVIASGQQIRLCRQEFPDTIIVSPGIRPRGAKSDDHKRFTTPREAILLGSDYLVVGRPILTSSSPRQIAEAIIEEIDQAFKEKNESEDSDPSPSSSYSANPRQIAAAAR